MHWFWRAVISVITAAILGGVVQVGFNWGVYGLAYALGGPAMAQSVATNIGVRWVVFILPLPAICTIALCVHAVMCRASPTPMELETRCRRCGYILRGISEPRCPECGERI